MGKRKAAQELSLSWDRQGELTITSTNTAALRITTAIRQTEKKEEEGSSSAAAANYQSTDKTKKAKKKRLQLYLVVDDWDRGYSIRKLDEEDDFDIPVVVRLEASGGSRDPRFCALGDSKIVALWQPRSVPTRATIYDIETGGVLADGPLLPPDLHHVCSVAAAGGRLYALHAQGVHSLELEVASPAPAPAPAPGEGEWSFDFQPPWKWSRTNEPLLSLPFDFAGDGGPVEITAYAAHPDGCTVFVSACVFRGGKERTGTFSLDTTATTTTRSWRYGWTHRGDWLLPFFGQGHYDATLNAWVGFHSRGQLCACHVPSATNGLEEPLDWTELIDARDLFVTNPKDNALRDRHDETLMTMASMGGNAQFCILEPLTTRGTDLAFDMHLGFEYVLRLTRFQLKRDRRGHLRTSTILVRSYKLRKYDDKFAPQAFFCLA